MADMRANDVGQFNVLVVGPGRDVVAMSDSVTGFGDGFSMAPMPP